jgi:hypothetical protein
VLEKNPRQNPKILVVVDERLKKKKKKKKKNELKREALVKNRAPVAPRRAFTHRHAVGCSSYPAHHPSASEAAEDLRRAPAYRQHAAPLAQ